MKRIQEQPVEKAGQVQTVRGIVRVEPGDTLVMDTREGAEVACLTVIPHEIQDIARESEAPEPPVVAVVAGGSSESTES